MDFQAIFDRYSTEMVSVHSYLSAIRGEADREYQRLNEHKTRLRDADRPEDYVVSMSTYSFRIATTGTHHFYASSDQTVDAQIQLLVDRTNRQYQWLLAEAYELFEDFLEHAYAGAGMQRKNLWPLRDYGALTLDDLESVDFSTLLAQARAKRDKPQSLLHPLRNGLALLKSYETKNALDVDLWFAVNLIEKLRHHIVHTKGLISSKAEFTEKLLRQCGVFNNGRPEQSYVDLIDDFVRPRGATYFVRMLDVPIESRLPLKQYVCMFSVLSDWLLAYAHLLSSCFVQVKGKNSSPTPTHGT